MKHNTIRHENKNQEMEKQKQHKKLSRDPNKAMQEMMQTIDRLHATLMAETKVLKETDTKSFMAMQDEKVIVAREYLDGMKQLIDRKDEIKNADERLIIKLEEARKNFAETAHENYAAINRMKNGMKRLGDRIMETARETARKEKQFTYGANGHLMSSTSGTIGINESA